MLSYTTMGNQITCDVIPKIMCRPSELGLSFRHYIS